ncbi:MAG TPA: S53 family peptidase [Rhizomicrobium sp.]|jgi:subtilase family serine protease|nr:S53 family peptidase [Rhizomicrobium sp.]
MRRLSGVAAVVFSCGLIVSAAVAAIARPDETHLVTLAGNTRSEARDPANDRGPVADSLALPHMMLVLKRPAAREAAFERAVAELTDRTSPDYHHWLSAQEIGERFGPAPKDVAAVTGWLTAHGFTVNTVYPSRLVIDFSGSAGQVRETFHTAIHALAVQGHSHLANVSDPRIPSALAPVVEGIVSLNDFHGHGAAHGGPAWTVDNCGLGSADLVPNCYFVTPPDLATIYDFNPLFKKKNTGAGQTIAVLEDSDIYSSDDWTMFRSLFGLSGYTKGSVTQVQPGNCADPGTNGDDFEAILDAEYSSSAAPDAAIEVASCASTKTTWGLTIAVENLLNETSPPPVMSVSYIWCEADAGKANDKAYYDAWQQAAAEGVSVFVSSGDEGAAACDYGKAEAAHGIAVNGLATTPYNVAVGGTDFGDTAMKKNAVYWSNTNSDDYGSALSYVPEIPWNSSCASQLMAKYVTGSKVTYGTGGFCNNSKGAPFITTYAGSGGPSSCALKGCKGYPKPSWQTVLGNPADKVRDIPDVSLFSAGPVWGHAYVVCFSDPAHDFGDPCSKFPNGWIYGYGTSFASPVMAGIQALVNQSAKSAQGNPDPVLYSLANAELGTNGDPSCHATRGRKIGKSCVFRDVTTGDMDVPCSSGTPDCYLPSGNLGVLSTSTKKYKPAFNAANGWDFATGLGSVDAANLVAAWPK